MSCPSGVVEVLNILEPYYCNRIGMAKFTLAPTFDLPPRLVRRGLHAI
jgi:hypothetical protein